MLTIRLQRAGKRNRPEFRIVLAEKESSASKKFAEILGSYNPRTKDFKIKEDRLQYWIAQHVTLSPTAHNLFVNQKLLEAPKVKAFSVPAKVEEKAAEPTAVADAAPAAVETAPAVENSDTTPEPAPAEVVETPVAENTESNAENAETPATPPTEA